MGKVEKMMEIKPVELPEDYFPEAEFILRLVKSMIAADKSECTVTLDYHVVEVKLDFTSNKVGITIVPIKFDEYTDEPSGGIDSYYTIDIFPAWRKLMLVGHLHDGECSVVKRSWDIGVIKTKDIRLIDYLRVLKELNPKFDYDLTIGKALICSTETLDLSDFSFENLKKSFKESLKLLDFLDDRYDCKVFVNKEAYENIMRAALKEDVNIDKYIKNLLYVK